MEWQPIETAPKDCDIWVYFDSDADPYQDPIFPDKLTSYGAWAEGGNFLDGKGHCVAKWHESTWENLDEYGSGYWMPAWWFAKFNGDYEFVVNPIRWMPLPEAPE